VVLRLVTHRTCRSRGAGVRKAIQLKYASFVVADEATTCEGRRRPLLSTLAAAWMGRGLWAVLDQALRGGVGFLLGIVLARFLPTEEFGFYAVAYSVVFLVTKLHTATLTEPMLVFGSSTYKRHFVSYLRTVIRIHWWGTSALCLACGAVTGVLALASRNPLFAALAAAMAATPFILFALLMRRSCYVEAKPWISAGGGAVYLAVMLAGLYALFSLGRLSVEAAFAIIALASLVAGVVIRNRIAPRPAASLLPQRQLVAEHWTYGRWALVASGLAWVPGNWYYILLPIWGGFQAAAALKALMILIMPVLQANGALGLLLLPLLARKRESKTGFRRVMLFSVVVLAGLALAYWAVLALVGGKLMVSLYGQKYADYAHYLPWLGALPVLAAVVAVFGGALRANENPRAVAAVYGVTAAVTLAVGTLLVANLNLSGAVWGMLISSGATALGMLLLATHMRGQTPVGQKDDAEWSAVSRIP